jgi:hypothetical protein
MDCEGFSGKDGRTTIFDYWSVDTLVRAAMCRLQPTEKRLKTIYDRVLNIARTERAVFDGVMFDLMYANPHLQRQYVFLRKAGREVLFVIANYDADDTVASVIIPQHAFDFLKLRQRSAIEAIDLMTSKNLSLTLQSDIPISVSVSAYSAVVMKFSVSARG